MVRRRAESGTLWLAEAGPRLLGAIVLRERTPDYISRVRGVPQVPAGREIYIGGFIRSRAPDARHVGQVLMRHARTTARDAGVGLLRLDCYAGGDGGLVAYYESIGFRQIARFTIESDLGPYHACLLEQQLDPRDEPHAARLDS